MQEIFRAKVKDSNSLDEVRDNLLALLKELKQQGYTEIGYISGIISSDGPAKIPQNLDRLTRFSEHIRSLHDFPVFSARDVFDDALFKRINSKNISEEKFRQFWQAVLEEDSLVTHMFMTPRWNESNGARVEHEAAKKVGMEIQYLYYEV